jgi:RNA polymerase sigma-70 factor (ECF subfamily)
MRKAFHMGTVFLRVHCGNSLNRVSPATFRVQGARIALDFIGGYTPCPLEEPVQFFTFDDAYLQRLRDRDLPTEQHFVGYFSQLLLIKLRSRLRSTQAVEDVRQETFVRVLKAVQTGGIRSAGGLGAFVNSICNNVLQEHYRTSARTTGAGDTAFDLPDQSIDLDGMLVARETREHVRHTLSMLSEKDRRLLRAMFFEDKGKDEICNDFGVDREYLRVLLHRAKQSFRARYEQVEPGEMKAGQAGQSGRR